MKRAQNCFACVARKISLWLLFVLSMALVGCDHATKYAAATVLKGRALDVVPGVVDLEYTENHDVAWTLLRNEAFHGKAAILIALATLGTIFVATMWWRRRNVASSIEHVGWSLAFAGALGNMLDRAIRGYVVDFIHVRHYPVFNVADVVVVFGVFFLIVAKPKERAK